MLICTARHFFRRLQLKNSTYDTQNIFILEFLVRIPITHPCSVIQFCGVDCVPINLNTPSIQYVHCTHVTYSYKLCLNTRFITCFASATKSIRLSFITYYLYINVFLFLPEKAYWFQYSNIIINFFHLDACIPFTHVPTPPCLFTIIIYRYSIVPRVKLW